MISLTDTQNQIIAVLGLGISGKATVDALLASGATVYAWDDGQKGRDAVSALNHPAFRLEAYAQWPWEKIQSLVMSPGIPLTHPTPHGAVLLAHAHNVAIISDIELLARAEKNVPKIAITGTNGKSTTTALIGHILKVAGRKTQVGGNIGIPVLSMEPLQTSDAIYVLELSSYQLDLLETARFNVAVWMNITPDHLDRHGDIAGYVKAKRHIFERQQAGDVAIIGVDDEESRAVFESFAAETIRKLIPISSRTLLPHGVSVVGSILQDALSIVSQQYPLPPLIHLAGEHNAQNIAAAYAATRSVGVPTETILAALQTFIGLPHRMQFVKEKEGVTFINDSKATNADSTEKALRTFENIHWILGGRAKSGGITPLIPLFSRVTHAYLIGEAMEEFAKTLSEHNIPFTRCGDLKTAFDAATQNTSAAKASKPVLLLSPACASFDQWPNFEARGNAFCSYVNALA